MTQGSSEGPETINKVPLVPDEPGDPLAEDREVKRDEAEQREGMKEAPPSQPWT